MEVLTMVGGAVLAPLFESLLVDLRSGKVLSYARKKGVLKELHKWEDTLKTIKAVLEKAEEQQRTTESVMIWFNDLQNLAYDVEDILDEFNTKAMVESKAETSKVKKMISWFTLVSTSEIKNISGRLQNIKEQMEFLKLSVEGSKSGVKDNARVILTSTLVDEAHVYGREEDRKKILNQLMAEGGDGSTPVIPIVGMGGVGKTTLVQLIYNDDTLKFDLKAWVTVGEDFNVLTIAKTILRQLDGINEEDFVSLQARLKEILSEKKCLVVLDDVWTKDYAKWNLFYKPFETGSPRSKIIVTTRDKHVSLMVGRATGYPLEELSDEDCLSIVAYHAFGRKKFNEHPHLKEVGEQIARKCDGLPLAARALGGVLRGKEDTSSWEELLNNKIWVEKKETSVLPALKLSYYHLPPCLKLCFRYTAIFPKDYEFDKTRLVPLWIAEGFAQQMNDGYKFFDELLARSFFQRSSYDESLYVMHDLMNDLARSVSGNICLNLDEEAEKSYAEVRHSAFTCREYDVHSRFERFHEMKHLRTCVALRHSQPHYWSCFISTTTLNVMTEKLKYLRVLALPYAIRQLPASIGSLKHLRCLDISYAVIEMLPESLCKLLNLKALILLRCKKLRRLPKDFCNLINLQFLDIRGTYNLKEMPLHISKLKNLHILGDIIVGESDVGRMLELLKIPYLQVRQCISKLQNARNVEDVECWEMRKMEGIDALTLECNGDSRNEKKEEVLSALKPQKNIRELSINWYRGREWPSWIGDPLFGKMKILKICDCCNVSSLPALGQLPSLEELTLEGMNGIKEVGKAFYGSVGSSAKVFPSLKVLRIIKMEELYEWSNNDIDEDRELVFPKLKKLEIAFCQKLEICRFSFLNLDELVVEGCKEVVLRSISNLASLTKLEISGILGLDESLNGSFLQSLGSLQEMVVRDCNELKHLWDDEFNAERLGCLKKLRICGCEELVSMVEEDEGDFPLNLQQLDVSYCRKLKKLPNQLRSLASLTDLMVSNCFKLETLSRRGLPYGLKRVRLELCDSLASLPEGIIQDNSMSQIEVLTILKCEALTLPADLSFPTSLRSLDIGRSLGKTLQLQNSLPNLTSLIIQDCFFLESFPDTTTPIPTLIPTLLSLGLRRCKKLRSLPNHMNQFTSLKSLQMYECPEVAFFPEGGLPADLKELAIAYCDEFASKVILEQSLKALASLEILIIKVRGGMDDVSSFPHDSLFLSTSLTTLEISGFKNLKSISSGIRRLTSLEELSIGECPQLESLPREGLPPSLGHLNIHKCPIMEKRCREPKGNFWPLVASIPAWQRSDFVHRIRSFELRNDNDYDFLLSKYLMKKYPWTTDTWYQQSTGS